MSTRWFLWAINDDPRTNEYLASMIGPQYPEAAHLDVRCADNARRNLWECRHGYLQVKIALTARTIFHLHLEVFAKEGDGPTVQWNLWKPELRRRARQKRILRSKVRTAS